MHAGVMHRDHDPDPVSGQIVKRNVRSFHAEFSEFSFVPGTYVEFRPSFHQSHSITFHRGVYSAASAHLMGLSLHAAERSYSNRVSIFHSGILLQHRSWGFVT